MAEVKTYIFSALPKTVEELRAMPEASLNDPFAVAALSVAVCCAYEGSPDDALAMLRERPEIRRVVLLPFMIVAGDHAKNDMAGPDPDSWRSRLEAAGYGTECVLRGLGEDEAVRAMFVAHAQAAEG